MRMFLNAMKKLKSIFKSITKMIHIKRLAQEFMYRIQATRRRYVPCCIQGCDTIPPILIFRVRGLDAKKEFIKENKRKGKETEKMK